MVHNAAIVMMHNASVELTACLPNTSTQLLLAHCQDLCLTDVEAHHVLNPTWSHVLRGPKPTRSSGIAGQRTVSQQIRNAGSPGFPHPQFHCI